MDLGGGRSSPRHAAERRCAGALRPGHLHGDQRMRLACAALLLFACNSNTDDDDDVGDVGSPDALVITDSGTPDSGFDQVEIGTGVEMFETLTMNEVVNIILGPQGGGRMGGYHLWHAVRVRGFNPEGITMNF